MSNEARKAEATESKVAKVPFRGQEFEIPTDYNEWTLELHEALADGEEILILRAAFGPAQWAALKAMRLKTPDLAELGQAVSVALGFKSVGESPASSD